MDVEPLTHHVLADVAASFGKVVKGISAATMAAMKAYPWPGNVRELQNEIQRMVTLTDDVMLGTNILSPKVLRDYESSENTPNGEVGLLKGQVEFLERQLITDALVRHRGNITRVADELGLSRVGLRKKLDRYDLKKVTWLEGERHG
jgi:two-component system response regulator HupR/HoxA